MRLLCVAALALSVGLYAAVTANADPKERAAKFADRKKKFETEYKDLEDQLKKAESPDQKQTISTDMRELVALTVGKMLTLTEDDPKDDASFDACTFILNMSAKYKLKGKEIEDEIN